MGVQFAKAGKGDAIVAVARNPEAEVEEAVEAVEDAAEAVEDAADGSVIDGSVVDGSGPSTAVDNDVISVDGAPGPEIAVEADDAVTSVDDDDTGGRE
jgi:DNA gyrase subunit A